MQEFITESQIVNDYDRYKRGEVVLNMGEHEGFYVVVPYVQAVQYSISELSRVSTWTWSNKDALTRMGFRMFCGGDYKSFRNDYLRLYVRIVPRMRKDYN